MLDDRTIICLFATVIAEQRCFRVRDFDVVAAGSADVGRLYIKPRFNTMLDVLSTMRAKYCFHMLTIPYIYLGTSFDCGLMVMLCACFFLAYLLFVSCCISWV